MKQRQMNWKFHVNVFIYIIGSFLFIVGSIFFHPHFSSIDSFYKAGVLTFTFGSILFCFGSFQQLIANFQNISSNDATPFDIDSAISLCRNTIGTINGFLFAIGSVAFWPTYGHSGAIVGNWLYRCGASLGVVSCMWLLIRLQMKSTKFTMMKLVTILSLFGSIGFLIGGGFFLVGGSHDIEGSFAWVAGSIAFLLSSLLIYKL